MLKNIDMDKLKHQLAEDGYAVVENVLDQDQLERIREVVAKRMAHELANPLPLDDEKHDDDEDIRAYYKKHYTVSDAEAERMVARIHQYRRDNAGARWPMPISKVSKNFLHLPTLFDNDKSQRVWNLLNKEPELIPLIEHPVVLPMVQHMMGEDCNLHDFQSTSIGPQTGGGAWHVDAPLGQIAEPLPEFPLTLQNVWMLDDFTADNGATRVMPGSHKLRKSPPWGSDSLEGEVTLTAPAGSVAIWLSNTWHRSGSNHTDAQRRAILCNYNVSWLRFFADFTSTLPPEVIPTLSERAKYLLGFGACAPKIR
ncbi:ectoine hydroxylase-related dioxygenase (phytanoyl-CoA dioxygenase family) [Advenella incenata]|jgi:ectoine hydroxylase-related dioxygenase (phytanoyl-CoA dioxygenase family)|uniref:Ectoine hydroxylase-related dioxygenase (Phytanoyl-CoA dioxygenase family) n=1 Tax=Advenella incenata TaxID=267800 RepID=A0A4Q7VPK8_9BURK|nr:phytanoyl-CoA dioxygenase family protein [Advenella incenata]RZT98350.1 ectoine hydroxylase-related dioxygenase (phytanoyl-CoA dioxygenase family) [Advenella incenata]